jgi:fructokinase
MNAGKDTFFTVVAFGEILWDVLPNATVLGGAPFNFIYRVNSLGDRGILVSRVGKDVLGAKALAQARLLGIDTRCIQQDDAHPTGTVPVTFDAQQQPHYVITPDVAYDHMSVTAECLTMAHQADCICFGTLVQRTDNARRTLVQLLEAGKDSLKLLDINLRKDCYTPQTVAWSLEQADILKLNETELAGLPDLVPLKARKPEALVDEIMTVYDLKCCVVTLGERGVFAVSQDHERVYIPGHTVTLADPIGAGDACTAGFIHAFLHGETLRAACAQGNALGALVATQAGATQPVDRGMIDILRKQSGGRIIDPLFKKYT